MSESESIITATESLINAAEQLVSAYNSITMVDVFAIISGIAAAVAVGISIFTYIHGLNRERKAETLKAFSEIRKKYFNTKTLDDKEKLKYINELEYFATGVNCKIYDSKIVRKMSGSRLISQYDDWVADYIQERRDRHGNKNAYCEYEKMIKEIIEQNKK